MYNLSALPEDVCFFPKTGVLSASQVGIRDEAGRLRMPDILHLSSEHLHRTGILLLCTTVDLYLWVGRDVPPQALHDIFGVPVFAQVENGLVCPVHADLTILFPKVTLQRNDNVLSRKVRTIIDALRSVHHLYMPLTVVKEDSPNRHEFLQYMVRHHV
jgi:protein transport protein SEC24